MHRLSSTSDLDSFVGALCTSASKLKSVLARRREFSVFPTLAKRRHIKVLRYSFSEAIPTLFNRLKSVFFDVRSLKIFTSSWRWIEICENVVLIKIDITMTTIKKQNKN